MRAHYLQHVPFEGPGTIFTWMKTAGYEVTCSRLFESEPLPDAASIDMLVIMGGPMSVNDEKRFPWLVPEKQFIREVIDAGRPVLGICLGAQLIAAAMGAPVFPGSEKEIGWFTVRGMDSGKDSDFAFPASTTVFHWHGETFDLPTGARRLAASEACANQAFQLGSSVIGLQFHLETTPESALEIVTHCRNELVPARFVQSEESILAAGPERYTTINRLMVDVLNYLHRNRV